MDASFTSFLRAEEKEELGSGGIPQGVGMEWWMDGWCVLLDVIRSIGPRPYAMILDPVLASLR